MPERFIKKLSEEAKSDILGPDCQEDTKQSDCCSL